MGTKKNVIMTPETMTQEEEIRSSAEIQSEIRETRGRMDATLDELGNRLTARSLFTSALDWWDSGNQGSTAARNALKTVYHQAREHPMPALLIGGGLAWLVSETMGGDDKEIEEARGGRLASRPITRYRERRDPSDSYEIQQESPGMMAGAREAASDTLEAAREKTAQLTGKVQQAGEKMHEAGDRIGQQAHEVLDRGKDMAARLKEDVKEGYQTTSAKFEQACEEHPLAVGVAFAALGALAGLAIPRTSKEDELMGEKSDHLMDETKEKASELLESGKIVGNRVIEAVKHEAEEQGISGSRLAEAGHQVVQKAKDEAVRAAEDEGLTQQPTPTTDKNPVASDPNCGC